MALVSILIPAYNGEVYIRESLMSALAQTHAELEVLVGDDASTDGTAVVVGQLAAEDPRVRLIRHERNVGAFENPIRLLEEAQGEFVKFLLQDDLLLPTAVERLLAPMLADRSMVLSTSHRGVIDANGTLRSESGPSFQDPCGLHGIELGDLMLKRTSNLVGELSTTLIRRSALDTDGDLWTLGDRRMRANGDVLLWLKLLARGHCAYSPEELSRFRRHAGQRSQSRSILLGGHLDWLHLIEDAHSLGFLATPDDERHALMAFMPKLAALVGKVSDDPRDLAVAADTLARAAERLRALAGEPASYDCVIAAPSLDLDAVRVAVAGLRSASPVARRCVITVEPGALDDAIGLIESELGAGEDFELDLVPASDPGALLEPGSLALVPDPDAPPAWACRPGVALASL